MLGQYEGIVDSEGTELLAVGQEEAEVLPRQGHQLQRYRDAGLGHVILQSAGRQLEAGRAGAACEEQVAWRKSIVLPAPVARGDRRIAGTLRILATSLDEQDGVAERDRLRRDASRVKNELVTAYSWDDRPVAGLGARASIGELADGDGFGLGGCLRNGQERQQNRETCQNFHLDHSLLGEGRFL